jgi:hypothetical protein
MLHKTVNSKGLCHRLGKGTIAVALITAQMKIAMGGNTIIAKTDQDRQQRHRVGSAAQCDDYFVAVGNELVAINRC